MTILQRDTITINPDSTADLPVWTGPEPADDVDDQVVHDWIAPGEDAGPDEDWDDEHCWNCGPAPDLAALVDREVSKYESWGNDVGRMLAHALRELAVKVRLTGAMTPSEYDARAEVIDADARDTWRSIGYQEGFEAGRCERPGPAMGHPA